MAKTKTVDEKIAELVDEEARADDEWLRRIVIDRDGQPNATDIAHARRKNWDASMLAGSDRNRKSLLREIQRMQAVVSDEHVAGTSEQRAQLRADLEAAQAEADLKVPALEQQIEQLKREQFKLLQKPQQLTRRVEQCESAVKRLRDNVPQEIRESAQAKVNDIRNSEIYRDVRGMKSRVELIEKVLVIPSTSDSAMWHAKAMKDQENMLEKLEHGWQVNPTLWARYLDSLRRELAHINAQLPALEAQVNKELAEAEKAFDFYAR